MQITLFYHRDIPSLKKEREIRHEYTEVSGDGIETPGI